MKFYTVATHSQGYFDALQKSAERNKIKLNVLGFGTEWKGFMWKIKLMKNAIEKLPDNEIVVFMDAFDVIFLTNEKEIYDKFKKLNVDMLIGGEKEPNNIVHKVVYRHVFKNSDTDKCSIGSCFLNSGMYISYVNVLKSILNDICNKHDCNNSKLDDQQILLQAFNNNKKFNIKLDNESKIFMNTWGYASNKNIALEDIHFKKELELNNDFFYVKNKRIINKENKNKPCLLHGPGNANLDKIMIYLNYPVRIKTKNMNTSLQPYLQFFYIDTFFMFVGTMIIYYILSRNLCDKLVCYKMIPWAVIFPVLIFILWFVSKLIWYTCKF